MSPVYQRQIVVPKVVAIPKMLVPAQVVLSNYCRPLLLQWTQTTVGGNNGLSKLGMYFNMGWQSHWFCRVHLKLSEANRWKFQNGSQHCFDQLSYPSSSTLVIFIPCFDKYLKPSDFPIPYWSQVAFAAWNQEDTAHAGVLQCWCLGYVY